MHVLRRLITCLAIATIFAISANGMASAANGVGHQKHCIDAFDTKSDHASADHAGGHIHDDLANPHEKPGHDHETCTMHACPALSAKSIKLRKMADTFLAKLSWPEQSVHLFERADGLKRPPKT